MGFDVERVTCGAFSSSSKGASSRLYSHLLVQRSGAPLQDLSKTTGWRSSCRLALSRETPLTTGWRSSRLAGTRKAEGSAALPSRVQWHCPRAPTPEPSKEGHRPKDRHSQTRNVFLPWCLVFSLSWLAVSGLPWFRVAGSPVLPRRVPVCSLFRLLFLSFGRGRHVPAGGRDVGSSLFSFRATSQEPFSRREEILSPARRQNPPELPLRLMRRWP